MTEGTWPGLARIAAFYVAICIAIVVMSDSDLLRLGAIASLVGSAIAFAASRMLSERALRRALWATWVAVGVCVCGVVVARSYGGSAVDGSGGAAGYYLRSGTNRTKVDRSVFSAVAAVELGVLVLLPSGLFLGSGPNRAGRSQTGAVVS
jgi:hypothetical protein